MSRPEDAPPTELFQSLLREGGIHSTPESLSPLGVSTSRVWSLTAGGQQYVLRIRLDGDSRMARKEIYLSELLRRQGVPAPVVLSMVADERGVATLSTSLAGVRLDRALEDLSSHELRSVWHSTGEALRLAHEIPFPEAGEVSGDRVEPFPGGWAQWVMDGLEEDLLWLHGALGEDRINPSVLERVIPDAVRALEDAPVRLIHNDALPQNVMAAPGPGGWTCAGWLDWEFARAADPLWDVATLDLRPAGLVPDAFYEGYGLRPSEPQASIYELLTVTWRTRAELEHGSRWDWPPRRARIEYMRNLASRMDRLAELLGVSG